MPTDIFDEVQAAPKRDIFDEVGSGDVFDQVSSSNNLSAFGDYPSAPAQGTSPEVVDIGDELRQSKKSRMEGEMNRLREGGRKASNLIEESSPMGFLGLAGDAVRAPIQDLNAMQVNRLHGIGPSLQGDLGNTIAAFTGDELPVDKTLAQMSKTSPIAATVGKIGQGVLKSAPLIAVMPEGALGKLVAAGFTADMLRHAGPSATALGEEMGKPPEERDYDKITSAISDLTQTAAFAPLAGAHGLEPVGRAIGERVAPKQMAIRELAKQLKEGDFSAPNQPAGANRRLGVQVPNNEFANPGVRELASDALADAQGRRILAPGEQAPLDVLRNEIQPPRIQGDVEPTRAIERPGGGPAQGGQVSFAAPAEARGVPNARQSVNERTQNAIQSQSPSVLSDVQPEPVESKTEVPTERTGAQADVGRGKEGLSISPQEKIVSVAVRNPTTGQVVSGRGIHLSLYPKAGLDPLTMKWSDIDKASGYLTSTGRFINQVEADVLARQAKQIHPVENLSGEMVMDFKPEKTNEGLSIAAPEKVGSEPTIEPLKGERLVELVHPDGKVETVAYADKFYDLTQIGQGKQYSIARQSGDSWSHGIAPPGSTIREIPKGEGLKVGEKVTEIPDYVTHEKATEVINALDRSFPGAAKTEIHRDYHGLPDSAHETAYRVGTHPSQIKAYYNKDGVHIVTGAHETVGEIIGSWLHEQLGHKAVNAKLGKSLNKFMEQVADSFADHDVMKEVKAGYNKAGKITHGMEFVAKISETFKQHPNAWNRIVAMTRQWLRDMGFVKTVTENDVHSLLRGAMKGMEKGSRATESGSLSLKDEPIPEPPHEQLYREAAAAKVKAETEWPPIYRRIQKETGLSKQDLNALGIPEIATHPSDYGNVPIRLARNAPGGLMNKLYNRLAANGKTGKFIWGGTADHPQIGFDPDVRGGSPDRAAAQQSLDAINKVRAVFGFESLPDFFGGKESKPTQEGSLNLKTAADVAKERYPDERNPVPAVADKSGVSGGNAVAAKPGESVPSTARNIANGIRDFFTIDPVPKLTRAGVQDSAVQHASARVAVPRMVNDLLGKVFGNEKPDFINSVMDVINKDNILGGHDEFIANRDAAVKAGDTRAANRWQKMADSVGDTQDIAKITKEVEAARNDPKVSQAIAKWKEVVNPELDTLYNEMKGVDPATEREGRGRVFGARVNLLPKSEEASWSRLDDPTKPTPGPSASNYRNPNAKRDKFDRAAKFTGNYSTDASAILSNVLFPRWNEVTKLRFYDDLVKSGKAFWGDGEVPEKINGEETTRLPVKVPETSKEGSTRQVEKTLVVPKSMVGEIRGVLDTDYSLKQNPLAKFATQVQLFQLTDAVSHLKNLHSVVANALGTKGFFTDIARKFPGIATGDSIIRIGKIISEIKSDSPAIRSELAFMAKNGMLREHYPATGVSKITKMQDIIHSVDTASRVTMNRFFDNLVNRGLVENTMQNRRAFVQQIGEYNKRLMSPLMRTMSRSGASPFIVAGRNFNRFSKRVISGSPGVTSSSNSSAAKMRLANVAGLTTMVAIPALINYLSTGTVWGRRGTPVGAVDLGFPEDEKGNHKVLDLLQLYGIRRGLRATGIQSVADGLANGVPPSKIVDNAISDATSTAAHPWMGPALGAGFSALTGRRLDLRGGAMPYEARKVGNDESQFAENARVTLKNQNAMIYGALRPLFNDTEESYGKDFAKDFLKGPASAIGLRDVKAPELAEAQKLAATGDQMTKEQADRAKQKRELAAGVRENPDASKKKLDDMVKSGELTKQNKTDIEKRAALSKIQYTVEKYLTPKDALQVYRMASPENKDNLRKIIAVKIFANQNLDSTEKANAFSAIQSETAKDDTLQYPPIKISLEYGGKSADFLISSGLKYEYEKLRQENLAKVRNEIESKDFYTKLPEAERTKLDASLKQRADQVSKGQFASRNFKKFIQVKP